MSTNIWGESSIHTAIYLLFTSLSVGHDKIYHITNTYICQASCDSQTWCQCIVWSKHRNRQWYCWLYSIISIFFDKHDIMSIIGSCMFSNRAPKTLFYHLYSIDHAKQFLHRQDQYTVGQKSVNNHGDDDHPDHHRDSFTHATINPNVLSCQSFICPTTIYLTYQPYK